MGPRARRILVMAIGAVALVVGGAGVALASGDDPGSGTGPGVAPAGDVSATTTIDVSDEATYRQALIDRVFPAVRRVRAEYPAHIMLKYGFPATLTLRYGNPAQQGAESDPSARPALPNFLHERIGIECP